MQSRQTKSGFAGWLNGDAGSNPAALMDGIVMAEPIEPARQSPATRLEMIPRKRHSKIHKAVWEVTGFVGWRAECWESDAMGEDDYGLDDYDHARGTTKWKEVTCNNSDSENWSAQPTMPVLAMPTLMI